MGNNHGSSIASWIMPEHGLQISDPLVFSVQYNPVILKLNLNVFRQDMLCLLALPCYTSPSPTFRLPAQDLDACVYNGRSNLHCIFCCSVIYNLQTWTASMIIPNCWLTMGKPDWLKSPTTLSAARGTCSLLGRTDYIICRVQGKMKIQGSLFKYY